MASTDSIEVHGILYVLKMIVDNKIVPAHIMAEKLIDLMKNNNRLPEADCKKYIAEWEAD